MLIFFSLEAEFQLACFSIKIRTLLLFPDLSGWERYLNLPVWELEVFPIKEDKAPLTLS